MKFVIVGAGALGTYFGLRMHEAGHDVTFLVREGRAAQIRANGLKIISGCGNVEWLEPKMVTNPDDIESADIALLGVKGYHLEGVLPNIKAIAEKGALIYPLLNGIEHMDILEKEVGKDHLLGGVAYIIATLNENGHVVHTGNQHTFIFGETSNAGKDACQRLGATENAVKMNLVHSDDIKRDMWQKYVFITAFSGITSASRLTIGPIRKSMPTIKLAGQVLTEMESLAKAVGIELPEVGAAGFEKLKSFPDEATSSMHQDLMNGRPMEVDHLLGGALRLGEHYQMALPHIETLYALLKPYEKGAVS
jgi:2-dehydropantoate 2-reductase